jgi:hypothetical protein
MVFTLSGSLKETASSMFLLNASSVRFALPITAGLKFAATVFNGVSRLVHGWESQSDAAAEAALSVVLKPEGGTDLEAALEHGASFLQQRPERDRMIFLLSDGMVGERQEGQIRAYREELLRAGIGIIAIGLGVDTSEIGSVSPGAPVLDDASELPRTLVGCLLEALSCVA